MTFFRRRRHEDLGDEIRTHLEMDTADRIDRGATPDAAARAARRELGNISHIQEATYDVWGWRWLERLAQDLRYAVRTLRRNPGFATVAIVSLALGIGANTALFQVMNAVRMRTLPVSDPASLVDVHLASTAGARGNFETWRPAVTYPIWQQIQARQQAFSGLFAWGTDTFSLTSGGEMRAASGLWVTGEFFNVLGVHAAAGRTLTSADDQPGCPARAVIGYGFWQRAFAGDPAVVGRSLNVGTRQVEIIGVTPPEFLGLEVGRSFDIALPVCADPLFSDDGKGRLASGTTWWLSIFGRPHAGWTRERVNAHLAAISPDLFKAALPPSYPAVSVEQFLGFTLIATPAGTGVSPLREEYESPLWLLLGIAGLVLVIACANLTNLLLARATARAREIATRLSLGASRGRIVRQLLTESLLLAAIGAAFGVLIAGGLSRTLVAFLNTSGNTLTLPMNLDWRVLGFTAALATATCILFGLTPALKATRVSPDMAIRAAGRANTSGRESIGLRQALVVAQVALSLALLFGSLLFARSLYNIMTVDPGFRSDGIVVAGVTFRKLDVPVADRVAFRQRLVDRVRAIPGVQGAASVGIVPISGDAAGNDIWPTANRTARLNSLFNSVGPGYFATMDIPLVAGRDFDDRDGPSSPLVAIVNETLAARLPHDAPVVGSHVTREQTPSDPEMTFEIVGVVRNSKYMDLKEQESPVLFLAHAQARRPPAWGRFVVRSSLPAAAVTAAVTAAMAEIDPRIGLNYTVLTTQMYDTILRERLLATLSSGFGVLAALLTIVGLYGLVAYTVTRRTNEIGVRIALGATRADIARLMMRETGVLLTIGTAVGVVIAVIGGRAAAALLYDVSPYDMVALGIAVATLTIIAFAATAAPARRASRIAPVVALRAE
jgi:putative ABC transport system permease protein